MIRVRASLLLLCAFASGAARAGDGAWVPVAEKRAVYVRAEAAKANAPTVVLLNGLTYDTTDWDPLVRQLHALRDAPRVIRYDMWGQGESCRRYGAGDQAVAIGQQVADLDRVLASVAPEAPVYLLGLSYGGALATAYARAHGDKIAGIVLVAPFMEPLKGQDTTIKAQMLVVRTQGFLNPLNRLSDDELYDYFLKINIDTTYHLTEPSILRFPGKRACLFRLVQGARTWRIRDALPGLGGVPVHLMSPVNDQYVPSYEYEALWHAIPAANQASLVRVLYSEHKLPEAFPGLTAAWLARVWRSDSRLGGGRTYWADPLTSLAWDEKDTIRLWDKADE